MPTSPANPRSNRTIVEGMRLVAAFEGSGLTQAAFARQEGESEKAVRETAEALGPGRYHVLTGRASLVEVKEEKKCVAKIML